MRLPRRATGTRARRPSADRRPRCSSNCSSSTGSSSRFVGLFVFNAVWLGDDFLKPENLRNLLNQNAAVGVVAVGMTLVIIAGGIDLSVGAVMAFAAAVGMLTMNQIAGDRVEPVPPPR